MFIFRFDGRLDPYKSTRQDCYEGQEKDESSYASENVYKTGHLKVLLDYAFPACDCQDAQFQAS